jgi:PAS domain S-box-containing protein
MGDLLSQPPFVESWAGGAEAFRALVENIESCAYLLDSECRYLAVNRAFSLWLERPESEILGRSVFDLWPRPLAVKEAAEHLRVLRGEQIEQDEEWPRGKDEATASLLSVRTRKVPVRDGEGVVRGVLGTFRETPSSPTPPPPMDSAAPAVAPSASQPRPSQTILVVDNEAGILHLAQTLLGPRGYRVLTAENGLQAVEIYRQDPTAIDVVLVDQNMPGLSGMETIKALRTINSRQRILLMTGGDPPEPAEGASMDDWGFLSKPWTPQQFVKAVRDMLA